MGRTGFRIEDILKDKSLVKNNLDGRGKSTEKELDEYLKRSQERLRWKDNTRGRIFQEQCAENRMLWFQAYWEGLRQYYLALSLDVRARVPTICYDSYSSSKKLLLPVVAGETENYKNSGPQEHIEQEKATSTNSPSSKYPNDSPLFELEKLASTKLSIWNSEFCPIKSLLEKKTSTQSRRRKSRTAFTAHQLAELEKVFRKQKYLTPSDRDRIAKLLNLSSPQVITWFQNRRAKFKRDVEEMKNDLLYARNIEKNKIIKSPAERERKPSDENS